MRFGALKTLFCCLIVVVATIVMSAGPAVAALDAKGGEGAYGKTDDIVITNFGFGLMIFFVLFITVMSIGQHLLKKRKER